MATEVTTKKEQQFNKDLQKSVKELLAAQKLDLSTIARGINKSPATLSLYMKSEYAGKVDSLEKEIENYLTFYKKQEAVKLNKLDFVETSIANKIFKAANMCQMLGKMGVCYGAPGIGKSTAIKQYKEVSASIIVVDPFEQTSAREVLKQIADQLKLNYTQNSTLDEFTSSVIKKLEKNKYLLIIDEAENLKVDIFKIIRKIHDRTKNNCGILFIGTDALYDLLKKVKDGFPYITNRIGYVAKLDNLKIEDVKKLVIQYFPSANSELISFIAKSSNYNARTMQNLLDLCTEIITTNNVELTQDVIESAKEDLLI